MVAKLKHFRTLGRRLGDRFEAMPGNDNQSRFRRAVPAPRLQRPVLACRWHRAPNGKLECSWRVAAIAALSAEEPSLGRLRRRRRTAAGASAAAA